jgi:diguanylate cyclase (GGDEF)-like protein
MTPTQKRWAAFITCLLLTTIIGLARCVTGPEYALSLFYLLPIALATHCIGCTAGIVISCCSAVTWLMADLNMLAMFRNPVVPAINAIFRLLVFLFVTRLLWALETTLEQQRTLALSDPLTQLANRRAFLELAERALKMAQRFGHPLSILYLDLDNFKTVNDRYGHHAGDVLLYRMARCIRDHIRDVDITARMGGDEFCVLLIDAPAISTWLIAKKLQTQILALMHQGQWPVEVSIGAATFISIPESVDQMIAVSDGLMYAAKQDGRSAIVHKVIGHSTIASDPPSQDGGKPSGSGFSQVHPFAAQA